ncbi:unnamed protein product, partial [Thlaspi arvense]
TLDGGIELEKLNRTADGPEIEPCINAIGEEEGERDPYLLVQPVGFWFKENPITLKTFFLTLCSFLSFPAMESMEIDSEKAHQRRQSDYSSLDERFEIQKEMYRGQQYSQIYFARLHLMRTLLYSLAPTWKPDLPVCKVLGLEEGKECILVGTLFKHMKLKPCVLDEYSKERSVTPLVKPHNFMHPDDNLILEDESGRVKLGGSALSPAIYVTGVVVALHGKETSAGEFFVEDVLEAGLPPQIERPLDLKEDKYVVLLSGLCIGSNLSNPLQFQLLVDQITGHLGDEEEQGLAAQIVHVVIAGNSVEFPRKLFSGQNVASKDQSTLYEPIKELDIMLNQIAAGVSVDIMPGLNDPANFALPQQPLNRCLFPGSAPYNTFRSCTNPHSFDVDNVRFLGTSGQNIDDLDKYSEAESKLDFVERTLRWRHLAPTAPNTLGCYPFTDRDPFLIETCPHVYFVGNQDKFDNRLLKGSEGQLVRLICIPKFCETGIAVAVNLRNLECHTISFSTQLKAKSAQIQHVNRKSSDELLRKFADPDVDESKSTKRRRKSASNSRENGVDIESNTIGLVERKRLLLAPASKRRSLFLRQLASGKSHLRNKSLVRTIGKTWRKTMEGASRVFIEKHYNRHRRLINDVV